MTDQPLLLGAALLLASAFTGLLIAHLSLMIVHTVRFQRSRAARPVAAHDTRQLGRRAFIMSVTTMLFGSLVAGFIRSEPHPFQARPLERVPADSSPVADRCDAIIKKAEQAHITGPKELKQGHTGHYGIAAGTVTSGCNPKQKCNDKNCKPTVSCEWSVSDKKLATVTPTKDCSVDVTTLKPGNVTLTVKVTVTCDIDPPSKECADSTSISLSKAININK